MRMPDVIFGALALVAAAVVGRLWIEARKEYWR
jgi:hypothetical protein